jgi:hypothetical protein
MKWRGYVAHVGESRDTLNEVENIWQLHEQRVARY